MTKRNGLTYTTIAPNVESAIDGDTLHVKIKLTDSPVPSSTGKMLLHAQTGGFKPVPGGDDVRASIMVGRKA